MTAVQLPFDGLPVDPVELVWLPIDARLRLYAELALDQSQREVVEQAIRLVVAKRYGRGGK
jgi:hypothetical protein